MTNKFSYQTVEIKGITWPSEPDFADVDTYVGPIDQESFVAYCARVSNPANQGNKEYEKLVEYLVNHKHWSPFEMVNVVMEIRTTRDIARQLLRHRSFSFQEFSQRYAEVLDDFIIRDARMQDTSNRQNSLDIANETDSTWFKEVQKDIGNIINQVYQEALERGIAKEQARCILPEGMTPSTLYVNGNLRSWMHYCDLRMGNGTQAEHMDLATKCYNALNDYCPLIFKKG